MPVLCSSQPHRPKSKGCTCGPFHGPNMARDISAKNIFTHIFFIAVSELIRGLLLPAGHCTPRASRTERLHAAWRRGAPSCASHARRDPGFREGHRRCRLLGMPGHDPHPAFAGHCVHTLTVGSAHGLYATTWRAHPRPRRFRNASGMERRRRNRTGGGSPFRTSRNGCIRQRAPVHPGR